MPEPAPAGARSTGARVIVVVDADASIPEQIRRDLDIRPAPPNLPVLIERVSVPRIRLEALPVDAVAVAEVCADAAAGGASVLYVTVDDDFGTAAEAPGFAEGLLAERQPGARLLVHHSGATLMGAGWQAVAAAVAARQGASLEAARDAAAAVAQRARVIAALEHPELVGAAGNSALGVVRRRAVVMLRGADVGPVARPAKRDETLVALRDRFRELVEADAGGGYLRVAVHHAAAEPAAQAMATWVQRHLAPEEVVVAPLTRHAAARLGPGMVGFAWYRDPA